MRSKIIPANAGIYFLGKQLTSINRNIEVISTNLNITAAIQGETVKEARSDQERRTRLVDAERTAFGRSEALWREDHLALMRPVRKFKEWFRTNYLI